MSAPVASVSVPPSVPVPTPALSRISDTRDPAANKFRSTAATEKAHTAKNDAEMTRALDAARHALS